MSSEVEFGTQTFENKRQSSAEDVGARGIGS